VVFVYSMAIVERGLQMHVRGTDRGVLRIHGLSRGGLATSMSKVDLAFFFKKIK